MPRTISRPERSTQEGRLADELTVLQAIYQEQVQWIERHREVIYTSESGNAKLVLRLPDGYLVSAVPEVIQATSSREDWRDRLQSTVAGRDPAVEHLDAIIEEFRCLAEPWSGAEDAPTPGDQTEAEQDILAKATVAVWLHHLLNTNKRKQVLSPASSDVAGYSKPGYPGVLLFSGPAQAVRDHVQELKNLNWQAFQVRLDLDEGWSLSHAGVVEVENIGDIVSGLAEPQKQLFLSAVMKI